uniref:Uncharacterized protein n=1 Tax=Arundo donax TaxID=35708 RepID=A0A0A8YCH9_ARUDO
MIYYALALVGDRRSVCHFTQPSDHIRLLHPSSKMLFQPNLKF